MSGTPVWTDPDFADLLAEDPELVAIADALQATRPPLPRRRLPARRVGLAAAAIVAVTAIVLVAPRGGGSQAATLKRIRSALTPRPGWVLHERDVTRQIEVAGGPPVEIVSESWTRYAAPYSFREVIRRPGSPPVEKSGTVRNGAHLPRDPAAELRRAVAAGQAAIAGRLTVNGRSMLRIVPTTPQRYGPWVDYVDATTFRPVRFEFSGLPVRGRNGIPHPSTSVVTITAYAYLPPTTVNLRLANAP
jgi:hypothetical protein